jgi:hypothetical protein
MGGYFSAHKFFRRNTMNFFRRRAILKKANFLELHPIRKVTEEITEQNLVIILMPRFTSNFAKAFIVPKLKSTYIKIKLDKVGSASWLLIDGKKSVGEIATALHQQFQDDTPDAIATRLTQFLTMLYEQRFISFTELN